MKKKKIVDIISFLFILLFIYAAVSKLIDFQKFKVQLGQSPLLTIYAGWVAILVPLTEVGIALLMISPRYRSAALYMAFSLMVMFTTYIIIILNFSEFVPCSCGGVLEKLPWRAHLIFNIGFIILAILAVLLESTQRECEPDKI